MPRLSSAKIGGSIGKAFPETSVLEERGYRVNRVVGTSAGAIVGALSVTSRWRATSARSLRPPTAALTEHPVGFPQLTEDLLGRVVVGHRPISGGQAMAAMPLHGWR